MAAFSITAVVKASQVFTADTVANTETITVAGKQYTFEDSLTDVDGNVKIGASDDATMDNLVAAINLAAGAGTTYAASMTVNPHCTAAKTDTDEVTVTAKVGGAVGNFITVAESCGGAWAGAATTLASGSGSVAVALDEVQAELTSLRAFGIAGCNSHVLRLLQEIETVLEATD